MSNQFLAAALMMFAGFGATSCQATPGLLKETPDQTRVAILGAVPIGTPIAQAEARLRSVGIKCSKLFGARFSADAPRRSNDPSWGPMDYLYCDFDDHSFPVSKRWQIAVVDEGDKVGEVLVSVGLTGP